MDKRFVEENNIVSRYVQGDLTEEQIDQFETLMFEDQDVAREVHLEMALRDELKRRLVEDVAADSDGVVADTVATSQPSMPLEAEAANSAAFSSARSFGVAASLLALLGVGYAFVTQSRVNSLERELVAAQQPRAIDAVVQFQNNMSNAANTYTMATNQMTMLWLDIGEPPSGQYGVRIANASGDIVWSESNAPVVGFATVAVIAPVLEAGQYRVSITQVDSSGADRDVTTYPLTVRLSNLP